MGETKVRLGFGSFYIWRDSPKTLLMETTVVPYLDNGEQSVPK
jgi:hypothetical protein